MQPAAYDMLAGREEVYWWHRARRWLALALLRRHGLHDAARIIDLGCGTGANLVMLSSLRPDMVVGVDLSPIALGHAYRKSRAALVRADISMPLPFQSGSFDACTVFNVLYHSWIADERKTLEEAARVLKPNGLLLVTEPAFPALRRNMDEVALAERRFRPAEFAGLCRQSGFTVLRLSCFVSFGVPLILIVRALDHLRRRLWLAGDAVAGSSADMRPLNPLVNWLFFIAARIEAWTIARGLTMPVGVTLCCLCRKAEAPADGVV